MSHKKNEPAGQDKTSPEILIIYAAHLIMSAHKISAADALCKSAIKLECTV
jgi:hypothetical protein